MIPFYSLLGYDINTASVAVDALGLFMGFVIGASLKHGVKILLAMLAVFGIIGFFAPSIIQSAMSTLTLVDPTKWLPEILGIAGASVVVALFFIGIFLGIWKG
jgi:hypothetical protein